MKWMNLLQQRSVVNLPEAFSNAHHLSSFYAICPLLEELNLPVAVPRMSPSVQYRLTKAHRYILPKIKSDGLGR